MRLSPMLARRSRLRAPLRGPGESSFHSIGTYAPDWGKAISGVSRAVFRWSLVLLLMFVASACSQPPPPEQKLRETIAAMQAAAETRDSAALSEFLAEDFIGPDGMDREQFRRYLAVIWLRNREVGVSVGPLDATMMPAHATVEFTAAVIGGEGLLLDRAQVWTVRTGWRREGDDWVLISAAWE